MIRRTYASGELWMRRRLDQGVLQQILGRVLVPGQHVGQPEQLGRPRRDELGEVLPDTLIHRRLPSSPHQTPDSPASYAAAGNPGRGQSELLPAELRRAGMSLKHFC
jgi:hypothetical protein